MDAYISTSERAYSKAIHIISSVDASTQNKVIWLIYR